jgi:hypothetical protein
VTTEIRYLEDLLAQVDLLPIESQPKRYWSQRNRNDPHRETSLAAVVHRVRRLVADLERRHYFAETLGFDCVDGHGETGRDIEGEMSTRVGKPGLVSADDVAWSEDDLCDFVEVHHDLAAYPTRGWYHQYCDCGFHPTRFSRSTGQALYRWQINTVLDGTTLDLRLAESGEDLGRMVRIAPTGLHDLLEQAAASAPDGVSNDVAHAIALFRAAHNSREQRRSAVVALAGILEQRRGVLKEKLLSKDEGALFLIANQFDIRHRGADQRADYDDAYLEWVFYWYLATIELTNKMLSMQNPPES